MLFEFITIIYLRDIPRALLINPRVDTHRLLIVCLSRNLQLPKLTGRYPDR